MNREYDASPWGVLWQKMSGVLVFEVDGVWYSQERESQRGYHPSAAMREPFLARGVDPKHLLMAATLQVGKDNLITYWPICHIKDIDVTQ